MEFLAQVVFFLLFTIALIVEPVHAFDGGDTAALILGLMIGILGICACVGAYARKRAGN